MAKPMRGCPMPWSQQEGTEEPVSVSQQGRKADATRGRDIADYNQDQRDQTLKLKQLMKKRRTLMQNVQKWSYLDMEHYIRGQ